MCKTFLILRFDGLFQSYGYSQTDDLKNTHILPTKSAVIGIIGAAMGIDRKNRKELSALSVSLRMAVREDRHGGILTDLQNADGRTKKLVKFEVNDREFYRYEQVGGHYAVNAVISGGKAIGSTNTLMHKEYNQDSAFTVILEGDRGLLEKIESALKDPVWAYTLGRYKCISSIPIFAKKGELNILEFDSMEEALSKVSLIDRHTVETNYLVEIEVPVEDRNKYSNLRVIRDNLLPNTIVGTQSYGIRYVNRKYIKVVCEGV